MQKFWNWDAKDSELIIDGVIASESWFDDEVTPKLFRADLESHSGDIKVRINSPGGDVFAGVSIYNMLTEHDGSVTVKVDGIAASIASLIAMAGDKIVMMPGSMMMVHRPWSLAVGNSEELVEVAKQLEQVGKSMVPIYAQRTGLSEDRIEELLSGDGSSDGTWMDGKDAVELGFADETVEPKSKSLSDSLKDVMSYVNTVKDAVIQPAMSIRDIEVKNEEKVEVDNATDTTEESVEDDVKSEETDQGEEDEKAEEAEVVKSEEDEPESEEEAEAEDEEEIKSAKEENMSKDIAKSQVLEPSAQATVDAKPSVKDYLQTKESMVAFANILEENAGKSSDEVRSAWKEHLEVKAGVTNPEIFLPETLIQEIQDCFEQGGEIWNRVTKTGADVWRASWDSNTDVDVEDGRAKGYNRSVQEEKAEQNLTFAERVLRPAMVYKYITLNREDVKKQRSSGALVRFVLAELPRRIIREVERAIVIGDGRAAGSAFKIQEGDPEGFYPIKTDTDSDNFHGTSVVSTGNTYADLLTARDRLMTSGEVVLVAKRGFLTSVLTQENGNGGLLFAPGTNVGQALSLAAVVEPDWMDSDVDNDAYLVVLSNYRVVGDTSIEAFTNFELKTNKQEYLQEIFAGGGLTGCKAAVAIQATS